MSKAAKILYRLFLGQAATMERQGIKKLDLQMPMDKEAWLQNGGGHGWSTAHPGLYPSLLSWSSTSHAQPLSYNFSSTTLSTVAAYMKETMHKLLPWMASSSYSGSFTADELRQCIRTEFREPSTPAKDSAELMDRAFTGLKVLGEQMHMAQCSSAATTEDVRVDVCTVFVGVSFESEKESPISRLIFVLIRLELISWCVYCRHKLM